MASPGDIDAAFSSLSHKPGLDIWRISPGYNLTRLEKSEVGKFYTGDAYVVLKISALKSSGVVFAVHFWLGKEASKTDAKVAASKAMDLDAALGSKATSVMREAQGHESDLFLSYFRPCIIPIPGAQGKPSPEANSAEPTLWQVKGRRFLQLRQVPCARGSLAHSDIYILNGGGKKVFQFNGAAAHKMEKCKALEATQAVRLAAGGLDIPVAVVEDNDASAPDAVEFWDILGGFAPIPKKASLGDDVEAKTIPPILSWVSANGAAEMARGPDVQRKLLEADRCLIVDTGSKLFVWKGRTSTLEDRRAAAVAAEIILATANRPLSTQVIYNSERAESSSFKELFADWQGAKGGADGAASSKLKAAALSLNLRGAATASPTTKTQQPAQLFLPEGAPYDVKVWQLNGSSKVLLPAEEVGIFYSGDCYLVQITYTWERKQEYLLFFWIGRDSTLEERLACSTTAERIADTRGGQASLVRVVQGREPEQFFSLMKHNLFFFHGGLSSTYKAAAASQGGDDTFHMSQQGILSLFQIKPLAKGFFEASQMPLSAKSLNSSECFVLLTPTNPNIWIGGRSTNDDLSAALAASEVFRPGVPARKLNEHSETTVFWGHLGGRSDYAAFVESKEGPRELRLFHVLSPSSSPLKLKEVPGFSQEDLLMEDVMVLDTFQEVFVWVGSAAPEEDKAHAFSVGLRYVELVSQTESRSKDTTVIRVWEGHEIPIFTAFFENWNIKKLGLFLDPYVRQLALISGKSLDELETARQPVLTPESGSSQRASAFAALQGSFAKANEDPSTTAKPSLAQTHGPLGKSQKAAALAALQGTLEDIPVSSHVHSDTNGTPTRNTTEPSITSPTGGPSTSSQKAAAVAALKGSLQREEELKGAAAKPLEEDEAVGLSGTQRTAALAALQGSLDAEQDAKSHAEAAAAKAVRAAEEAERGGRSSAASQRAAALAALQGSLAEEAKTAASKSAGTSAVAPEPVDDTIKAVKSAKPAAGVQGLTYSLEELHIDYPNPPPGIDTTKRETYLSDADFLAAFGETKEKFYTLPQWKQDKRKRSVGLY